MLAANLAGLIVLPIPNLGGVGERFNPPVLKYETRENRNSEKGRELSDRFPFFLFFLAVTRFFTFNHVVHESPCF
jgi:hypothetical protein